jgi:hypothetical protein
MKRVLIIGATSAIATACARRWAAGGARLFLVARDEAKLAQVAADLTTRGADSRSFVLDATDYHRHAAMVEAARTALDTIDVVLVAHGSLPDQRACEADASLAVRAFDLNATTAIALLTRIATVLEHQRHGVLGVITSVAGDRGRPANYVYASAKAALATFCEGLRARLFRTGVAVVDIRPGFVATPMTAGLPLPASLVAQPDAAARRIVGALDHGRPDVLYVPAFWALIMLAIRSIPGAMFKRLRL